MDIRNEIRRVLNEVLSEAIPTQHFKVRVSDRLTSGKYTTPVVDYSKIKDKIETLRNTNFTENKSFSVFLYRFSETHSSIDPETDSVSHGNELWAVVRDNEMKTIFFRGAHQRDIPISDVDHMLNINQLEKNFMEGTKNSDGTVDFNYNAMLKRNKVGGSRKNVDLDFPRALLGNKEYYVDVENEKIIAVKNIKKTYDFDDLGEEDLEIVIDAALN